MSSFGSNFEERGMELLERSLSDDEDVFVRLASNGDLNAFNQLVLIYQHMIYNHACAILGDPASAEDVTQETFIKAFQKLSGFRGGTFRSWLMKIATNSAYDMLRRSQRRPTQPLYPEDDNDDEMESPAWLADPSASVEERAERNEEARYIYKVLDELPEVYRSVLTLIDLYEFDYIEAAQSLQVPIGTVKSRLARARLQMQAKLRETHYAILPMPHVVRDAV
jgi:RNA polymerase sigma-70 factor, ECF subfamily